MTEGCGCARPVGLSLPTAKSTEGKPQEWAAGRDAVRTAETREATAADEIPANPLFELLPEPFPDRLRAECACANQRKRAADRNDFRDGAFARRQSNAEPGGRATKITCRGHISQHIDGL